MELSGIELRYLVNEIKARVTEGYYVSSVSAVTKDSLLLKLHHPTKDDIMLMLSVRGLWITKLKFKTVEDNSLEYTAKAEIERSKLESIEQAGSERIVMIKFRHPDGKLRVVVGEFFGEGNLIICNEEMQIISILNPIEVRHRTLNVGLRYALPPARGTDIFDLSLDHLLAKREKGLDVRRWIGRTISIPKKFAEEVAKKAGIEPDRKTEDLSDQDMEKIFNVITTLVNDVSTGKNHEPIVIYQNEKPQEALPIVTKEASTLPSKKFESYMDAVDEVLSREILDRGRGMKTVELDKQIAILEHDLEEQNKAKEVVIQKSAAIRKVAGELMALSAQGIGIDKIQTQLAESAAIVVEKGVKYIEVSGERVQLNDKLAKVASLLFERAKEMERGGESIEEAKKKLLAQIDRLRNQAVAIHKKVIVKQQVSKEWYERYRWFVTGDGLLAIGGRDASSNSALVRKHLTEHDIIYHAEVHGSPFFIVKNAASLASEGKIDATLEQVAQATVSFSRAWKDGLSSADAYWVMPEQVKKGAPTGQYLPKGSFVIEGKRNYIKDVEIRLAIGIMQLNERLTLVCGPSEPVRKKSIVYSVLLQGGMDPMTAAKKVKSELVANAGESDAAEFIKGISLDDFVRSLPNGQSKISFSGKGEGQQVAAQFADEAK